MRPFLRRFPVRHLLGGLPLFALICAAALAGSKNFRGNAATLIVTSTADSGAGSLRAALTAASDGDTIQFDPALNGQTISLSSGELVINTSITISGPGANLLAVSRSSGAASFRIFHIMSGHTILMDGLTITGGIAAGTQSGGGILNEGTLSLANSAVRSNTAYTSGGISNTGSMTITNSIISSNSTPWVGGGIRSSGTLTIVNSAVSSNYAGHGGTTPSGIGGGIYVNGGSLELIRSTVSGNTSVIVGGGVGSDGGTISITDSTITNNLGTVGGGIGTLGTATVDIRNSAISGNNASLGGGISAGGGQFAISNSSVSNNSGNSSQGGGIATVGGPATIANCTVSGNMASQGGVSLYVTSALGVGNTIMNAGGSGANIFHSGSNTFTSLGYNISSDAGGGFLSGPGDQINTNPLLGPLQDNGGPTFTHALLPGSPAIDAGDPNFTPPPSTDQRGYARVYNGRIDIGSVEMQPPPIAISGTISYCTNPVPGPVPNVTLALTGSMSASTLSDGSGNYTLSSLPSGGSYTVTPTKAALTPGATGINTVDVIAVQRHFLNIALLSGCPLAAADVNGNTSVNTADVIAIQRFSLGLTFGFANVGKYQFTPANRTYPAVGSNESGQNYDTLVFGDVVAPFVE